MPPPLLQKLTRSQIDDLRWNTCVEASAMPLLYGLTWYWDIVSADWEGLVWEENGQYLAVMPLPIRRKWRVLKYLHQPLFCQLTGVWALPGFALTIPHFLESLPHYFSYIPKLNHWNKDSLPPHFTQKPQATHVLDLSKPYSTLYQAYTADRKLNLNRAKKMGWEIVASTDIEPTITLFKQNTEHKITGGVGDWAYTMLARLYKALHDRGLAQLWYAQKDDKIEAAALFSIYQNRIIYLFNTATPTGRTGNARTLVLDKMIEKYAESSFVLDFESPDNEDIVHFYKSFNAQEEAFAQIGYEAGWVKKLRELVNITSPHRLHNPVLPR